MAVVLSKRVEKYALALLAGINAGIYRPEIPNIATDTAKGLAPKIQASAEEIEQSRRLPLPVIEAMAQGRIIPDQDHIGVLIQIESEVQWILISISATKR